MPQNPVDCEYMLFDSIVGVFFIVCGNWYAMSNTSHCKFVMCSTYMCFILSACLVIMDIFM